MIDRISYSQIREQVGFSLRLPIVISRSMLIRYACSFLQDFKRNGSNTNCSLKSPNKKRPSKFVVDAITRDLYRPVRLRVQRLLPRTVFQSMPMSYSTRNTINRSASVSSTSATRNKRVNSDSRSTASCEKDLRTVQEPERAIVWVSSFFQHDLNSNLYYFTKRANGCEYFFLCKAKRKDFLVTAIITTPVICLLGCIVVFRLSHPTI